LFSSVYQRLGGHLRNAGRIGWVFALARVNDLATTVFAKTFITYVTVTVPATNVLAVDVFGTGIFH
jgi:hypothetical protein